MATSVELSSVTAALVPTVMANSSNASHPIAALRQERAQAKSHPQTHKATSLQKRNPAPSYSSMVLPSRLTAKWLLYNWLKRD
jgi:hypothetical protein